MGSEKSPMNGHESPYNGDREPGYVPLDDVNAREIEADIDRTRRHMDETLDQLGERLSPHHLVDDVLDFMKAKGRAINSENVSKICMKGGKHLGQFVKDHPGPALMAGAGIFWYFLEWSRQGDPRYGRSRIESVSPRNEIYIEEESAVIYDPYDELSVGVSERRVMPMDEAELSGIELNFEEDRSPGMASRLKEKTSRAAGRVGEIGSNIKDSVSESASRVAEKVSETGSRIRQGLGDTAHATSEKIGDLGHRVSEGAHRTGEKLGDLGHRMTESAHRTGEKLGDLGHRMSEGAHRVSDRASRIGQRTMGSLREGAHRATEKVEHLTSKVGHTIKSTADSGVHMVSRTASKVKRGARRTGHQLADTAVKSGHWIEHKVEDIYHESDRRARQAFEESPLGVGLAVAGIGLLFGALMPSTRIENKAIGGTSDDLKQNLRDRGDEIKHRGEEAARRAVGAATSQAKKAGLTATHVLETLDQVVSDVKDAALEALGGAIVDIQDAASQALEDESLDPKSLKESAKSVIGAAKEAMCSKSHEHSDQCVIDQQESIDEDWEKNF